MSDRLHNIAGKMLKGTIGGQSRVATPVSYFNPLLVSTVQPAAMCIAFTSADLEIHNGRGGAAITHKGAVTFCKENNTIGNYNIRFGQLFGEDRVDGGGFSHTGLSTDTYNRNGFAVEGVPGDNGPDAPVLHLYLWEDLDKYIIRWPLVTGYTTSTAVEFLDTGAIYASDMAATLPWGEGFGYAVTAHDNTRVYRWDRSTDLPSTPQSPPLTLVASIEPEDGQWELIDVSQYSSNEIWVGGSSVVGGTDIAAIWRMDSDGTILQHVVLDAASTGFPDGPGGSAAFPFINNLCEVDGVCLVSVTNNWAEDELDYDHLFTIDHTGTITKITDCCTIDGIPLNQWCVDNHHLDGGGQMQHLDGRVMMDRIGVFSGSPKVIMGTVSS